VLFRSFGDKIVIFDRGNKWFIPSFIEFQYPSGLNPQNNAHGGVIRTLEKYSLLENKPQISPSQEPMDMDMVKDMEMDKVMDKEGKPEKKEKSDSKKPTKEEFLKYCEERCAILGLNFFQHKSKASVKYDAWDANGWKDLNGNKISNWKAKIVANLQYWKDESGKPSQSGTVDLNKDFNYSNLQ